MNSLFLLLRNSTIVSHRAKSSEHYGILLYCLGLDTSHNLFITYPPIDSHIMMTLTRTTVNRRLIDSPPHRPLTLVQMLERLKTAMGTIGQPSSAPVTEPPITQHVDRYGNVYWHVYDAKTGRNIYCMSQSEVALWMDRVVFRA